MQHFQNIGNNDGIWAKGVFVLCTIEAGEKVLVADLLTIIDKLCAVVHALQKERKRASLFSLNAQETERDDYGHFSGKTDAAIGGFIAAKETYEQGAVCGTFSANRLNDIELRLEKISSLRDRLLQARITCTEAINHYTFGLNVPIIETISAIGQNEDRLSSPMVTVFDMFVQWKERFSRENAFNSRALSTDAWRDKEFKNRMESLLAEKEVWLDSFLSIATPAQIKIVKGVLLGESLERLKRDQEVLKSDLSAAERAKFVGTEWVASTDAVIDDLHDAERRLLETLEENKSKQVASTGRRVKTAGQDLIKTYLRPLEIFTALSDDEIADLAAIATVKDYPKGHLFYMQGEPARSIHIIVGGWVKVFNSSDSGEETILQMLTAGETLLESAVILDTNTPASAQAEERATVVSIPSKAIRACINENAALARTMLNNVSLKSQMMIYQMEQTRLKSAYDRVGWFLLRLSLDQGGYGAVFHLPYDKATIASYLDMRPETFSRALKAMKKVGIQVSNDHIEMEDQHSLCQFCDSYLANTCDNGGTIDCPRPELSDNTVY